MTHFARPADKPERRWPGAASAALASLGLHLLALFVASPLLTPSPATPATRALEVRMRETKVPSPATSVNTPPAAVRPIAPRPATALRRAPPVAAAAARAASPLAIAPAARPAPAEPPPETPPAVRPAMARLAADYLHNPQPAYPEISRRRGEQGTLVLAVRVSDRGRVEAVEISQSSGLARLDEAAVAAVEQWRFVPARRGAEAIESTVLVPLRFSLDN